jgi:Tfp pilus assembly protein PilZ
MNNPVPPQQNRRRFHRKKPKKSTKVVTFKGSSGLGYNLALSLLDLSETGIRMVVRDSFQTGQDVEVNLESICHQRPIKVLGKVVWCMQAADGSHCVGIHFYRPLPYADIAQCSAI